MIEPYRPRGDGGPSSGPGAAGVPSPADGTPSASPPPLPSGRPRPAPHHVSGTAARPPFVGPSTQSRSRAVGTAVLAALIGLLGISWVSYEGSDNTVATSMYDTGPETEISDVYESDSRIWEHTYEDAWGDFGDITMTSTEITLVSSLNMDLGAEIASVPVGRVLEDRDGTKAWAIGVVPKGTKSVKVIVSDKLRATHKAWANITRNHPPVFQTTHPTYDVVLLEFDVPASYSGSVVQKVIPQK